MDNPFSFPLLNKTTMTQQHYTMDDLRKRVEENAVATMGMLMPDEALRELVNNAIDRFFKSIETFTITGESAGYGYSSRSIVKNTINCSAFELMVWKAIQPIAEAAINEVLQDTQSELSKAIEEHGQVVKDKVKDITIKNAVTVAPILYEHKILNSVKEAVLMTNDNIAQVLIRNRLQIDGFPYLNPAVIQG